MTDTPRRTAADFSTADRSRIAVRPMPAHIGEAVRVVVVGQMAASLIHHRADLSSEADCRDVLVGVGYGIDSINTLLGRAISAASGK